MKIKEGINLYKIHDKKFKTFAVSVRIYRPLCKDEATKNALLSWILKQGSKDYPTTQALAIRCQELYASSVSSACTKSGDSQILQFHGTAMAEEYTIEKNEKLQNNFLDLLFGMIFNPIEFETVIAREKETLKDDIKGVINDKVYYARKRMIENMCADEPFAIPSTGFLEDIDGIEAKDLKTHFEKMLADSVIDIFIAGNFDEKEAEESVKKYFEKLDDRKPDYPLSIEKNPPAKVKEISETMDIAQGKLSMGFRVVDSHEVNTELIVYNEVLGGGITSKLFENVREKLSLCYYVASRCEFKKGIMFIDSGIAFENYQKAIDEIFKQIKEIEKGKVLDKELEIAKISCKNRLKAALDSPHAMIEFYANNYSMGDFDTIDDKIKRIMAVTRQECIAVSNRIKADTIYFLKGEEQ